MIRRSGDGLGSIFNALLTQPFAVAASRTTLVIAELLCSEVNQVRFSGGGDEDLEEHVVPTGVPG